MFGPDSSSSLTIKEFKVEMITNKIFHNLNTDTNKDFEEKNFYSTKIKFSKA